MGRQFGRISSLVAGTFFAWVTDGATPEELAGIKENVPAPRRTVRRVRAPRRVALPMPGHQHRRRVVTAVPECPPPRPRPVEDRIWCSKNSGLGGFLSREQAINAVWLELVLATADLTA
jgi:hypothetical protein